MFCAFCVPVKYQVDFALRMIDKVISQAEFWLLVFFMLFAASIVAQTISGTAPGFEGRKVALIAFDDLFSEREVELASATVDAFGQFSLKVEAQEAQYAFLRVGRECADFILEPGKDYTVRFVNPKRAAAEVTFSARFFQKLDFFGGNGKPLYDVVGKFNSAFVTFLQEQYKLLKLRKGAKVIGEATKAFKSKIEAQFPSAAGYLAAHIKFSLAQAELVAQVRRDSLHARYFKSQWLPGNFEFVRFLRELHGGTLRQWATANANQFKKLMGANNALYRLDSVLMREPLLVDKRIREAVLLMGLGDFFRQKETDAQRVAALLREFASQTKEPVLARAARNLAAENTRFLKGAKAPNFSLSTSKNSMLLLSDLKGKTVVLEITDPTNPLCLEEALAFVGLHKTYGSKAEFVSVVLADSESAIRAFANRIKPLHTVCRARTDAQLVADYGLAGVPSYFVIGPTGAFLVPNARTPSRGLEADIIHALNLVKGR